MHHNYVVNIENELKYENQRFVKKKSYFVQHITMAHHTWFTLTFQRRFSFQPKGNEHIPL